MEGDPVDQEHRQYRGRHRRIHRCVHGNLARAELFWQRLEGTDDAAAHDRPDNELQVLSVSRDPDGPALDRIEAQLRTRNVVAAEAMARQFLVARPARIEGHILLGRALQMKGDFAGALNEAGLTNPPVSAHPAAVLLR